MTLTRRSFLAASGLGVGCMVTGLGTQVAMAQTPGGATGDKLVTVFLSGGADGLTLVPPIGTPSYYDRRPNIAIPQPNEADGALPLTSASSNGTAKFSSGLDGMFGLHPLLQAMYPIWQKGQMAIIVDAGLPGVIRSHFRAIPRVMRGSNQDPGSGWLGRVVAAKDLSDSSVRAVSDNAGGRLLTPLGTAQSVIGNLANFGVTGFDNESLARAALTAMYDGEDNVSLEGRRYLDSVDAILQASSDRRPGYPNDSWANPFNELASLLEADLGVEAAALTFGGWDFHRNSKGRFSRMGGKLGGAIGAFAEDTGLEGITLLVITEFGRTINQNGNGGTDHGQGFAAFVMGAGIQGGVYGTDYPDSFPASDSRYDLPITTDYRKVISDLAINRVGVDPGAVGNIFPGYSFDGAMGLSR